MRVPHNERLGSDIDGNGPARASEPERRCILTGDHGGRSGLIRLAIAPEGMVLPDVNAKAPGRGAWICVNRGQLETAIAKGQLKGALARAFKGAPLVIPDGLADLIEAALMRAFTDRLGLEMRAGRLILGTDRIADQARMGKVAWLAHAADAGDDGNRRLDQAWRVGRDQEGSGLEGMRLPLDRAALSVALGRDNVVHLALGDHASAQRVQGLLSRLLHFAGTPGLTGTADVTAGPSGDGAEQCSAPAVNLN